MNYIIILALILIYGYSITSIFGSINIYSRKTGASKLKQAVLDFGYQYSVFWTNFVGLGLSGMLQCSPLAVVSSWYVLLGWLMPLCYWFSYEYYDNRLFRIEIKRYWDYGYGNKEPLVTYQEKVLTDNLSELLWGFCFGLGLALSCS